jgi:hypothetical protein
MEHAPLWVSEAIRQVVEQSDEGRQGGVRVALSGECFGERLCSKPDDWYVVNPEGDFYGPLSEFSGALRMSETERNGRCQIRRPALPDQ